ncbi:MAG: hypothetical protein JWO38_3037 [Gemmataceae bacterium]|nr:hypothetical protein [Gemmataceae bacterium]
MRDRFTRRPMYGQPPRILGHTHPYLRTSGDWPADHPLPPPFRYPFLRASPHVLRAHAAQKLWAAACTRREAGRRLGEGQDGFGEDGVGGHGGQAPTAADTKWNRAGLPSHPGRVLPESRERPDSRPGSVAGVSARARGVLCRSLALPRSWAGSAPARPPRSRLPQHQIHHPAPPDMRPVAPAVGQDVGLVAPGVLEGVGQDRHRGEVPGLVHLPGE